ncbi:MAG: hypothetical protein HS126_19045 [Anaerolineales bacterium]|nr:hypothetical protein [Anaerolineales bacterium]
MRFSIYCDNDPCESEANVIRRTKEGGIIALCNCCNDTFNSGQMHPEATNHSLEDDLTPIIEAAFRRYLPFVHRVKIANTLGWGDDTAVAERLAEEAYYAFEGEAPGAVLYWLEDCTPAERIATAITTEGLEYVVTISVQQKDYADMSEAELGRVIGRFRAGDEEVEYDNLLAAINRVEEIANYHHVEVWVHEWDEKAQDWSGIWEVDGRRVSDDDDDDDDDVSPLSRSQAGERKESR